MTCNVFSGTLNPTQSIKLTADAVSFVEAVVTEARERSTGGVHVGTDVTR